MNQTTCYLNYTYVWERKVPARESWTQEHTIKPRASGPPDRASYIETQQLVSIYPTQPCDPGSSQQHSSESPFSLIQQTNNPTNLPPRPSPPNQPIFINEYIWYTYIVSILGIHSTQLDRGRIPHSYRSSVHNIYSLGYYYVWTMKWLNEMKWNEPSNF